jgi:membrane fusion protein (multidrug efflux system)
MTKLTFRLSPRGILILAGVVVAAIAAAWWWHENSLYRTTENAYVNARIVQVSSLVMGPVVRVDVQDNQYVHKGDLLFEIDRRPFDAAQADVAQQTAALNNAQSQLRRTTELVRRNFMSKQAEDDAQARVRVAQAEVAKAKLDLEHTVVRAPEDGFITHFDLTAGTVVTPGNPLFAIVVGGSFWVDANFKETELGGVVPGRPATIVVDMYPGHTFHGRVQSLAGGTGAAFSLLPPQNANGNWVKITQRVPVRVSIDDPDARLPLRVGATATVRVAFAQ